MRAKLVGKNLADIRPLLDARGIEIVETNPELIIAHGGDGTLLRAERDFPNIPKLPIRDTATAPLCPDHAYESQLDEFLAGKSRLAILPKISGSFEDITVYGINDVFIHAHDRVNALRYRVRIDDELYANEIVGDGVGLASVHGSTAYYRSITHSLFRVGVGLAFSNSTEEVSHLVLSEKSTVEIEIVRGPAIMIADNTQDPVSIAAGGRIRLRQSDLQARIYALKEFMCPKCRLLRHPNKLPFKGYF
jgi:NAD+ kinase